MKETHRAYTDLCLAMTIVGSSVVCGKIMIEVFPPFLASGMRFFIAALVVLPLVWRLEGGLFRFKIRDWGVLAAMAFCGQFLFTVLLLIGLKYTSAVEAGLITSTTPAAMAVLAALILGERPSGRQAAGVALAVLGVAAVNAPWSAGGSSGAESHLFGNLLICGAVMGEAAFLLLRKTMAPEATDLGTTAALILLGLLMFLPPALYEMEWSLFRQAGPAQWAAVVYFGVVFTGVAYFLWFRGVSKVPGHVAGVFTAVMPMSAVGLSWLILGEPVLWNHLAGGGFVLAAIGMMTIGGSERSPVSPAVCPD